MGTALATVPESAGYSQAQLDLIKQTVAKGTTDLEFQLFVAVCQRTGLDPFAKQVYAIKRGDKLTIQTGIDGYRLLAARTGDLAGIDDVIYDSEDGEHPSWARVTVYRLVRDHRVPFTATARWKEYRPTGSASMWDKMPYLMLGKCAEALALRKAFPAEISGVYTAEEMSQADADTAPTYVDAEPAHTPTNGHHAAPAAPAAPKPAAKPAPIDPWAEVRDLAASLQLSETQRKELFARHGKKRDAILAELREMDTRRRDTGELPTSADEDDEYTDDGPDLHDLGTRQAS